LEEKRPPVERPLAPSLVGILEGRTRLQRVLGGAGKNEPVVDQLELRHRYGDILLCDGEKAAGIDVAYETDFSGVTMTSSIDPMRSFKSLNTGDPMICLLALQPTATSRNSAYVEPRNVDPATCACETAGPATASAARTMRCAVFMIWAPTLIWLLRLPGGRRRHREQQASPARPTRWRGRSRNLPPTPADRRGSRRV
jgi:hypothetical protein